MQDVSSMSDAELLAALGQPAAQPQARPQPQPQQTAPMAPQGAGGGNLTAEALFPALVQQESRGRAGAVGPDTQWGNALGRTQMLPATAREMAQRVGVPFDEGMLRGTSPEAAAYQDRLGMAYLQEGFERTGNPREALMYYHGGPDRRLWGPKTRAYADEVLGRVQNGDFAQVSNGQQQAPAADFGSMSDEALMAALQQPEAPAEQTGAPQMYNGRPVQIEVSDPIQADASGAYDLSNPTAGMDLEALRRGDRVTLQDRQTRTLRGTPYADNSRGSDEQVGSFNLRLPNATDTAGAFATASTEQIPFADEAADGLTAMLNGQSFSERRAQSLQQRERMNQTNGAARDAGGWTGFGLGLAAPGGGWVQGGNAATRLAQGTMAGNQAMRMARAGRAGALGAGYGALYGAGAAEGGLENRAPAAAIGGVLGGVTGPLFQIGADRLARGAAQAAANPTPQRRLSRQGQELTLGQMFGGGAQRVEDALTSIPFAGDVVRNRQRDTLSSFDNVATNTAIRSLGQLDDTGGRAGVRAADEVISGGYQRALRGVSIDPGDAVLQSALTQARDPTNLTDMNVAELDATLGNIFSRARGVIDGDTWKRIDSDLAQAARAAERGSSNTPSMSALAERFQQARAAWRDALGRVSPDALEGVSAADAAEARYRLVRKASSDVASAGRGGDASPATLNRAVVANASDRRVGRGESLLQDLTDDAMQVLPRTVPDSGTPLRSLVTGAGLGGGAASVGVDPATIALAAGLTGGVSALYSRPAQRAFNGIYRFADRPGATAEGLSALAAAARQNPALVPLYERALLQSQLAGQSPGQSPAPRPAGLFGSRAPRMAPR